MQTLRFLYKSLLCCEVVLTVINVTLANSNDQWDEKGYILFCLCMGRFGNQAEHFLGGLAFAKSIDRTLVLPPWRTYKNVPFDDWFDVSLLSKYHRVILAEEFMEKLAPKIWPAGKRTGFCYGSPGAECNMKNGNPFGPFWNELGVDFDNHVLYTTSYSDPEAWKTSYPPDKYPVIALKGAPASFPMAEANVPLQKYLKWSTKIEEEVSDHIKQMFGDEPFIGIHLRNGIDWKNACEHVKGLNSFMASPQCLGYDGSKEVTPELCFPAEEEILRLLKKVVISTKIKHIYIATDQNPMTRAIASHLLAYEVQLHHLDPWLPLIDIAILGKSDHFIGNCVSSFTSFVARERLVTGKPTYYWSFS